MCHYITAIMSADGNESAVRKAAESFHLRWKPLENQFVARQLRDGERYYLTANVGCNCGTLFGADATSVDGGGVDQVADKSEGIRQKGLKKGWTSAKIERAIEQKRLGQKHRRAFGPDRSDLGQLKKFVTEVLSNRLASYVGLFLHYYEGPLESAEIALCERRWIRLGEFDEVVMRETPEDSPLFATYG